MTFKTLGRLGVVGEFCKFRSAPARCGIGLQIRCAAIFSGKIVMLSRLGASTSSMRGAQIGYASTFHRFKSPYVF